jgi:hypothetical protein
VHDFSLFEIHAGWQSDFFTGHNSSLDEVPASPYLPFGDYPRRGGISIFAFGEGSGGDAISFAGR